MAQDVFSKMAEEQWILNEDGYLNIDTDVKEIIYHPYLNVILICTHTGVVRVLDVNSGVILHSSSLSAQNLSDVKCKYIPSLDRVLFTDGQALGVRSDYNGVLLLDSILQKNINDSKEEVQIELPLSEAIILKESLISSNIHGVDEIINELTQLTSDAQKHHKKGIKAQKWNTVCLTVPLEDLRYATSTIVSNLLTKKQHIPELGVASAVQERLSDLLGEKVNASDRKSMASEWRRRETYSQWPHMDYRWALPDQMAQAGFYHQPNTSGDDRAMCFTCSVCLVSWERTDEPCSEHERHSPNCPFVVGEYTQNVPLSVTYATCAAVDATYGGQCIRVLGHSSVVNYIPAANNDGLVSVFDVTGKVRRDYCFYVTQFDSFILDKYTQDFGQSGGWLGTDIKKHPVEKKIGAVCIVGDNKSNDSKPARPSIICGLTLTSQSNNDTRIISQPTTDYSSNTRLYLVVYDFTYNKELEDQEILQCNNTVKETIYVPLEDFEKKDSFSDFLDNLDPTMSSYYKSFLPGESDEVFLPPSLTLKKNHTGPKVLVFDDFSKVPISDSSLPPSKAKHLFNGPMSCAESETSISDHIAEVKNSKSSKKLNYSRAVQCVSIPEFCKSCQDLEISDIIPTHDQNHLLICLKGSKTSESFLVIYQLDFSEKMVKLKEEHVLLKQLAANEKPLEINLLPVIDKFGIVPDKCCEAEGNAIMVCEDGVVRIVSLSDLNIICYAKIEDDGFVSAAFCNSLDRLCASTKNGSLHFYVLNNAENESSDDHEDDDPFGMNVDSANALSQSLDNLDSTEIMKCFQKPPDTIPLNDLKTLKFYCDFEPLKTGYCVVVPPCWSEFQQSLRQRRQPQCDGEQSSKTWRLLTDTTTWDEHIFEITLPGATVLGHVDVHFTLQPSSTLPNVEITLLRQNKNGIGHKRDVKFAVDETVTIDMLQWVDNPVTSQEYLRAHNADILAGPIDLASHLDLTEQSGIVTLTSPKLYKTKVRNLLLHIRAVNAKDDGKSKAKKNTDRFSTINTDKFGLPPLKTDIYMGCDVIHELSLTLHTVKHPENSKERAQRSLMLESGIFVESLLLTAVTSINNDEIGLVLDTLDWIASIRLSRNRSNNGEAPNQQLEFLGMIEERLEVLLYQCLLLGGRSVAHKAVRLIITCCSGSENISPSCGDHFNSSVLKALTSILDSITEIKSASGLQWMFSLLLKVTAKNKESMIATKCTALLSNVANELLKRSNPYHLVLRGRYGLYGTPMEPELFDVEPPPYIKGDRSSTYMLPSNPTQQEQTPSVISTSNYSFNKDSISPKDILSTSTTKLKYKNVASLRIIRGLIETQPLHFTCIWSSEGTRVERADSNINSAFLNNVPIAFSSVSSDPLGEESVEKVMDKIKVIKDEVKEKPGYNKWVIEMLQDSGYLEHKGISDIVFINPKMSVQEKPLEMPNKSMHIPESNEPARLPGNGLPWQELLTIPPKQVIVVERMQSGARRHITLDFGKPVLLTDVFIPFCADLVTLTIDIWLKGEDVDETRLVVAMDIGTRNLLLTDLQPPPLCRYMKITVVGRYGMSTVRCRIPLGYFYGHITVMSDETSPEIPQSSNTTSTPDLDKQLGILSKLFEDINCRYSLACSKLKELLQPFIVADMKNAAHLATYMNILKDRNTNSNNAEHTKIVGAYQESIKYQYQLNIIKNVMTRIEGISNVKNNKSSEISTDKLASIAESLLEVLLSIDATTEMSKEECQQFFKGLCMTQHSRLQLLGAMFLEKHCGKSLFWGDFLADTLAENFATSCIQRFPQDRLFILLSYLSRKSSEKSSCIDAALRILHDTLTPLITNRRPLLAATVDLPLISWELMYLSLQLSLCKTSSSSINRWNWVLGEMVGTKNVDNSKGNNRKKTCKRMVQVSSNTLPSYSSIVVNSDNSYQQKMKSMSVHDKLTRLKCIKKIQDEVRLAKEKKEQPVEKQHPLFKMPQNINSNHCLVVAKGLLQLILSMDHSSSADMLLLCFKVISKLVTLAKLQLGQLLKENQLLDLIHFCISSKIPWAPFALACFLQDVMELSSVKIEDIEMETETVSSPSWIQNDAATEVDNSEDNFNVDTLVAETSNIQSKSNSLLNSYKEHLDVEAVVEALLPKKSSTPIPMLNNANFPPLPSVFESEDSDFDELLGDSQKIKTTSKVSKQITASNSGLSCAMDMRLELGVQSNSEITLKKLLIRNTHLLIQNVSLETSQKESYNELNHWPTALENLQPESSLNNQKLLTFCFASLFENIHNHDPSKIEHILQLWLTLNSSNKYEQFAPGAIPQIVLNCSSINYLISAMAWTPGLSLTTWCSALQTLTLVCNTNNGKKWFDLSGMAHTIVTHVNFVQFFLNLLSGTGPVFNGKILAGPLLCKALHDFLVRLQIRCDVVSPTSKLGNLLKSTLLKVTYQLTRPSGSVACRLGPLDAQCKLLQTMLYLDFANSDLSIAMSTLESTAALVHSYVINSERVKCISIGEKQAVMTSTFSDIFASVLGSDSNKQDRPVSYEDLLILLLKLLGKLVQTPLPNQQEAMDTESAATSQTDESKAEQINQENSRIQQQIPCFADIVLQHHPTVIRLCRCLAACKSSSLCMLANVSQKVAFSTLSEPNTVGDAIFHLLALLARKASNKDLLLRPLLIFLSQAPQLSEPLLWFILQVLDTEEAIEKFFDAGGITILGNSIVNSTTSPSTLSKVGTISTVMQHFSSINNTPDVRSIISSASSSKKVMQTSIENKMALVNFAPYCTISCESSTAQSADVLIQGSAGCTHRRARAPLWSYHFYPEENHTELMLQLPNAVLLREVQLQPHSANLATSPSYVALEVSANGPSRLSPVCLPLPTSGLTFIRLHLPVPKVVNCVLIRLYKPHDANSIGLIYIRLLGNYAFGGSLMQGSDAEDESHCKHSLGWLRLLHHCFTLGSSTEVKRQIIESASAVPNLLTTCCGLLLVPSHILPVYLPCLEKVLRELVLHSSENSYQTIKVLLDSRSDIEPLMVADASWQDRLINISGYQSACELLYQICEHQDDDTPYRIKIILEWLETTINEAILIQNTNNCNAAYFSSIASILWTAKQTQVQYDLTSLISLDLFNAIYTLKTQSKSSISLKYSLDSLLCSLCYIMPDLFPILLEKIGVLVPNLSTGHQASISDDRKDSEGLTDDNKRVFETTTEWYGHLIIGDLSNLNLTSEQLETIALVSRSPTSIQQLLDSGLPKLLNSAILEFCHSENESAIPMAKLENVSSILQFFTDISDEKMMRDWLGSEDGSSFWLHLLKWLCKSPNSKISSLQTEARVHLEEVCVKFLSKCCLCHSTNQARLSKVLCDVIYMQPNGISGFMRRLILQLLLENEKIPVNIEADETLYKSSKLIQSYIPAHPAFKQTYNRAMLCLSTNTTLLEILEQHIFFKISYKSELSLNKKNNYTTKRDIFKSWFAAEEQEMSMAAGVTAKDKRAKDAKNQSTATPQSKKKRYTSNSTNATDVIEGRIIKCETYSDQPLPLTVNLGQLLRLIESKGNTTDWPYIHLKIYQCKNNDEKCNNEANSSVFQQPPICSALQVFSSMGGLALLAQHLPTVYPEAIRSAILEKSPPDSSDSEWIKVDESDDVYEDILEDAIGTNSPSKSSVIISHVPPHSLTAFGLFLRLPGYAEVLLKDMKKALYLLRLTLGVTDDGEGGDIFNSPISDSLPTLPFEVLKKLYDSTPLSTDDGRLLRRISINIGVVHLLLACIGIFSHQSNNGNDKDNLNVKLKEDKSQLYWAKGTGFGTGSTQQSWNVEQALLKQKSEEEHVTVLLQVLASYINPNDDADDELTENVLPRAFYELLTQSALLPAISSYLRNDSVLDMARHIPLYRAVLLLLRAIAVSSQLVSLLLPQKNKNSEPSISSLLKNMKSCVDTYASKLRLNTKSKSKNKLGEQLEELDQGEGLATLMPDIQNTANLVSRVTSGLAESDFAYDNENSIDKKVVASMDEQYLRIMKNLQFSSYEMITELPEGGIKFVVSHHFENNAKTTSEQSHPTRVKRIAQEAVTLSTSLPLSYSSSVFVRYDNSRLDVMKVLITGPADTPYANGCFELDVFFPPDYPLSPMMINLETTGHHTVRFNPNLYNDGKVCLSVLNTWHGRPEEKWNAQTSSFLQVLVSIQSLILVPEPYFNEPGYERARGTPAGTVSSRDYNLNICQATVRWAMLEQILNPCPCFKEIIQAHFYIKRFEIIAQVEKWISEVEQEVTKEKKSRTNKKSPASTLESFKKVYQQLREALVKLRPPPDLEEDEDDLPSTPTNNMEVTIDVHQVDNMEKDMMKMVNDMCE